MSAFTESVVEQAALAWLESITWRVLHSTEIAPQRAGQRARLLVQQELQLFVREFDNVAVVQIIAIDSLELREGVLPPRVRGFVMEWAKLHQAELSANWTMLAEKGMFERIPPLV